MDKRLLAVVLCACVVGALEEYGHDDSGQSPHDDLSLRDRIAKELLERAQRRKSPSRTSATMREPSGDDLTSLQLSSQIREAIRKIEEEETSKHQHFSESVKVENNVPRLQDVLKDTQSKTQREGDGQSPSSVAKAENKFGSSKHRSTNHELDKGIPRLNDLLTSMQNDDFGHVQSRMEATKSELEKDVPGLEDLIASLKGEDQSHMPKRLEYTKAELESSLELTNDDMKEFEQQLKDSKRNKDIKDVFDSAQRFDQINERLDPERRHLLTEILSRLVKVE